VCSERTARDRLEAARSTSLTPLVGRESEVTLLLERWAQVKDGLGQVVLLSGEAGIGISCLVQVLKEHVASEPEAWLTSCQCSPRPDFRPPWAGRAHLTQVTLNRLPRRQAAEMTGRVARGKALPPEVVEQIVAKTDGVPLFVEELTKMVLESGLL
jgi:predicted ATPase